MADVIQTAAATKQDLIVALVQRELAAQAKLARTAFDVSAFAVKGARSISFPKLTSFTAAHRAFGGTLDAAALTDTVDKLDLDKNAYIKAIIDSSDEVQSSIEWQMALVERMVSGHARYVDTQLITALETATNTCTTAGNITKDIILEMSEELEGLNANMDNLCLVVSPKQKHRMLAIQEFIDASRFGSANPVQNGVIGQVYGVEVIASNLLGADQYFMYEKNAAIALGFQKAPSYAEEADIDYGSAGRKLVVDQLFGVKVLQGGALIIKDNNA